MPGSTYPSSNSCLVVGCSVLLLVFMSVPIAMLVIGKVLVVLLTWHWSIIYNIHIVYMLHGMLPHHSCTHTHTVQYTHAHTHTVHTHAHICTCTHTYCTIHTCTHKYMHTYAHIHTHAHTHTVHILYTHTYMHTHRIYLCWQMSHTTQHPCVPGCGRHSGHLKELVPNIREASHQTRSHATPPRMPLHQRQAHPLQLEALQHSVQPLHARVDDHWQLLDLPRVQQGQQRWLQVVQRGGVQVCLRDHHIQLHHTGPGGHLRLLLRPVSQGERDRPQHTGTGTRTGP